MEIACCLSWCQGVFQPANVRACVCVCVCVCVFVWALRSLSTRFSPHRRHSSCALIGNQNNALDMWHPSGPSKSSSAPRNRQLSPDTPRCMSNWLLCLPTDSPNPVLKLLMNFPSRHTDLEYRCEVLPSHSLHGNPLRTLRLKQRDWSLVMAHMILIKRDRERRLERPVLTPSRGVSVLWLGLSVNWVNVLGTFWVGVTRVDEIILLNWWSEHQHHLLRSLEDTYKKWNRSSEKRPCILSPGTLLLNKYMWIYADRITSYVHRP